MSKFTRRSFVKTTAGTAALFTAAPAILKAQGANDKIGMAVVGAGGRGGSHISAWKNDSRTNVTYIVEADEGRGKAACDQLEKAQGIRPVLVKDMREAFDSKDVDAISTATPNHWHALCGIWAMQAGKDAYIEKPVCHNIAEGRSLVAAARRHKQICQVGTQSRSSTALHEAVKFIREGGIGDVNFARGFCYKRRRSIGPLGDYRIPEAVDFNWWSGPAEYTEPRVTRQKFHYDWHWQRLYGNGDLGNQGPHQTDIARWFLGVDTHPNSVFAYGGRLGYQAERNDPDYVDAGDTPNTIISIYDYGDKSMTFETRGLSVDTPGDETLKELFKWDKGNIIGVIAYGTNGYMVQRTYSHCIAYDKDMNVIQEFKGDGDHFGNFLDAVASRNHEDLNADVLEGHLSAAVSHLGNICYYLGESNKASVDQIKEALASVKGFDDNAETLARTVKHLEENGVDLKKYPLSLGPYLTFDPVKEVFTNSPEATALCTRKYRTGFVCPNADEV